MASSAWLEVIRPSTHRGPGVDGRVKPDHDGLRRGNVIASVCQQTRQNARPRAISWVNSRIPVPNAVNGA